MQAATTPQLDPARLASAVERLFSLLRHGNPPNDISLTAASTLRRLEREGPRRLTELAAAEGVTQPAMTQLVQRLEREGLAARAADPDDGRVVLVGVTDDGRELLARRRAVRARHLATILGDLDDDDQALIAAALPALEKLERLGR
ncbi:MarR family transcriptional regulator [Dactylosporangium sp. AC04546]|uniref:MarR family winged helix-turn-helix transcriptional regulator n=1 Tax=Dactylosporangium sp. AC04546 TaxID=2862460 RepID=UPI001EE001AB|nr:MarR family transcriptional regulator [Dactylosporangium sp. AC04546]WVK80262.1 MarR family transcriptional regulator [Dactylosporangium sp. AC04546]